MRQPRNPVRVGDDMHRGATFGNMTTEVDAYRYELTRMWEPLLPRCNFIMLNPSTADDQQDDPTIRRVVGFCRLWGYGAVVVTNLFAVQSKSPKLLRYLREAAIGPENDRIILKAAGEADRVVAAWGVGGKLLGRDKAVLSLLADQGIQTQAIHLTADGTPCHPLYLPGQLFPRPIARTEG